MRTFSIVKLWLVSVVALTAQANQLSGLNGHYKIGVIAPLSGPVSTWGNDIRNTLLFAQEQLGAERFKLIFEDDRCLGKEAVSAAHKLINVDQIDFAIVACTEALLATAPIFEKHKITVISSTATAASISEAGDYIFRMFPSDAGAAKLLFDFVRKRHSVFGMLTEQRGYPQELAKAFLEENYDKRLQVYNEDYLSETTNFQPYLLRLKQLNVEGLFINTNSEVIFLNILKQLQQLSWTVKIYGVYMPGSSSFLKLAQAQAEGIIYVAAPTTAVYSSSGIRLFEAYIQRFGMPQSADFVFGSTFETLRLFINGTKSRLYAKAGDLRDYLYTQGFSGLFGKYHFDQNGDICGVQHSLQIIRNGKSQALAE